MPGLVPGIVVFRLKPLNRHGLLVLRSPAKPGVSKDEEPHRLRRMVRDGALRLLTMRLGL
ncbi:hypothetical protein DU475_16235 [Rhodopseudomonas sp. WA056]|nr:hypothetical protein [Rhodopseudomonas sp. WA056]